MLTTCFFMFGWALVRLGAWLYRGFRSGSQLI